ncbi:hypothetical protein CMI47_00420 [Candidatus Pacearchaeota archaeon]|nr:hypothetical protein [Candidatus Pacearchaeota archaeon]|tara:strand:+ start:5462 stop:5689 length:228 start_codon:yes stop_codon:yes gene_type:complete
MKIKNYKKTERFEVCNCCGKAFTAEENMEKAFHDAKVHPWTPQSPKPNIQGLCGHLEENEDCKGYFEIQVKGGRR